MDLIAKSRQRSREIEKSYSLRGTIKHRAPFGLGISSFMYLLLLSRGRHHHNAACASSQIPSLAVIKQVPFSGSQSLFGIRKRAVGFLGV